MALGDSIRELSGDLIPRAIAQDLLSGNTRRLIILPTSNLGTVPFAALYLENKQLVDVLSTVLLADIDGLFLSQPFRYDHERNRKLVVGDPDLEGDPKWQWPALPEARREVVTIAEHFGVRAIVGSEANDVNVVWRLQNRKEAYSLIYFATHGLSDAINPMDGSFLALSKNHFYGRDISKLNLFEGPLVVLSACQTGLGKIFDGGVFGLARAWHYAGAPQVVMSLWSVDDFATRALMEEFALEHFSGLRRSIDTRPQRDAQLLAPEEALRTSMLKLRRQFPNQPALWAAFTVYGLPVRRDLFD